MSVGGACSKGRLLPESKCGAGTSPWHREFTVVSLATSFLFQSFVLGLPSHYNDRN